MVTRGRLVPRPEGMEGEHRNSFRRHRGPLRDHIHGHGAQNGTDLSWRTSRVVRINEENARPRFARIPLRPSPAAPRDFEGARGDHRRSSRCGHSSLVLFVSYHICIFPSLHPSLSRLLSCFHFVLFRAPRLRRTVPAALRSMPYLTPRLSSTALVLASLPHAHPHAHSAPCVQQTYYPQRKR